MYTIGVEVEWNPGKAASNLRKLGVQFADAAVALEDSLALTIHDPRSDSEDRFIALGSHYPGTFLVVVFTLRQERATTVRRGIMKKEYDFEGARRGPVIQVPKGKKRVTIRLDEDIVAWFKGKVENAGGGNYQSLINAALRRYVDEATAEPLEATLRRVLREELRAAG